MKKLSAVLVTTILATSGFSPAQAQDDLIYVAVEPCRVADTRKSSEGVIKAGTFRNIQVTGTTVTLAVQGGQANCPNPKAGRTPVAVAAYILAIPNDSSIGKGVLSAYPSNQPPPPVGSGSTVNFAKDQTIGNTTIATLCTSNCPPDGELAVTVRNSDEDVVVDVQGYFYSINDIGNCSNADIAGNWQTFVADPALGWSSCSIEVDEAGKVNKGTCIGADASAPVTSGQLQVDTGCDVTGELFVASTRNTIELARISADRNLLIGIVTIENSSATFNAVRY